MAWTRQMLQQRQSDREVKVAAHKRKGDRKKTQVKLSLGVIFSWQYLDMLPFALPADYDCALHRACPHRDSDWGLRPDPVSSSACPTKQYVFPGIYIFTGLLLFYSH